MFYSQFILAKKGPLGTIWIAAHLERKLRKNQVADTDIGVSVDSILFPEVPIALRLSSHLLLGVVRIYSRKVNYLFHDCSEALLNIKQAFRSTAVDLPPEESTAPYHSITLPETFDLDDFELPDNALFQGNFVDHHVSTREQITLQDTMDGLAFSTSQFGPDERFGDADASQIGLDFDEELFMDEFPSTGHASVPIDSKDVDPQTSYCLEASSTPTDVNGIETSKDLSEPFTSARRSLINSNVQYSMGIDDSAYPHGDQIQAPDLNEELRPCESIGDLSADPDLTDFPRNVAHVPSSDSVDCAQAPSTPGLMEGAIVAGVHEVPTLSLLRKNSLHDSVEGLTPEANEATHLESLDFDPTEPMPDEHVGSPVDDIDSHAEDMNHMDSVLNSMGSDAHPTQKIENGPTSNDALQDSPAELLENGQASVHTNEHLLEPVAGLNSPNSALLSNIGSQLKSLDKGDIEKVDCEGCSMPEQLEHDDHADTNEDPCARTHVLQACNLSANQPNGLPVENAVSVESIPKLSSTEVGLSTLETEGKMASDTGVALDEMRGEGTSGAVIASNIETEAGLLPPENEAGCNKLDGHLHNVSLKDTPIESSKISDLPAPETLLSAPEGFSEVPNDLLIQSTLDKEVSIEGDGTIDRFQILSGRKRSLPESTLLQNSASAKLSGMSRSKRSMDYVPEDDDVLASILVGRRTPSLKIKSTPEVISSKRPRMTSKTSMSKRKALMDDTMVVSGDVIRQQLTNTEDIRRTRRKAPCTRHEIWMIQNNLLEEEIFSEPLFTGVSAGLTALQKQMYHKTRTRLSLADSNYSVEAVKQLELSRRTNLSEETSLGGMDELSPMPGNDDTESKGHAETVSQIENQSESAICSLTCDTEEQILADVPPPDSSEKVQSQEPVAVEIDLLDRGEGNESLSADKNNESAEVLENEASCLSPGHESVLLSDGKPVEACDEMSHLAEDLYTEKDASTKETAAVATDLKNQTLNRGENASIATDASITNINDVVSTEAAQPCSPQEFHVGGDGMLGNSLLETVMDILTDSMNPVGNSAPFPDSIVEISEPDDIHDGLGRIRSSEMENGVEGELVTMKATNGETHSADVIHEDGSQFASECPLQLDSDPENLLVEGQEHLDCQEVDRETVVDMKMPPAEYCDMVQDFDHMLDENDTDFLNVDDDEEPVEEENDNTPGAEEGRFVENSGWSSRTRAVARYLQSLFDREAGRGRKYVAMDNLLVSKTRKEASRMFFETLVLKTKDYIQVEQPNPLDNINVLPTTKLTKLEF